MAGKEQMQSVSPAFLELVGQALTDEQFRDRLYSDRAAATKDYKLTPVDEEALEQLTRERLEEQVEVLAHANQVAISIVIRVKF